MLRRRGPLTMAPSQLGAFTRSDPSQEHCEYPVPRTAAFARQVRRASAPVSGVYRQRHQCPADQPRRAYAEIRGSGAGRPPSARTICRLPEDQRVAADSIRVTRRIVAQPALQKYSPVEYLPGARRAMRTKPV